MNTAQARKTHKKKNISPRQWVKIDAKGMYHKDLNRQIRTLAEQGARRFDLQNVYGQRYIGTNLWATERDNIRISV